MPTGFRRPGEFCWINVLSPDPAGARHFFADLLGWEFSDLMGVGDFVFVHGSRIGGLFDLNGPQAPAGTPPGIGLMVRVESADAMAARVTQLGGTAKPAVDVEGHGRMAECTDPNGAMFDLWEPGTSPGTDVDGILHGAPSWFENMASDRDRASEFYQQLFGWTAETNDMGDFTYTSFKLDDSYVAGMMQITPEMGSFPSHWGVYFTVDDADAAAARASELGGQVVLPPRDIPGIGRFAGIISPQGVMFYVIRYVPMEQ
jgi:predicted enzyme related to lactoylglutathione lyase